MADDLKIYDIPSMQAQVHIHGDASSGKILPYDRSVSQPLDAYESAMAEASAKSLGIQPLIRSTM